MTMLHLLWEALWCWPVSGPQLWRKSDETGFLTLKVGRPRVEGGQEAVPLCWSSVLFPKQVELGQDWKQRTPPCHLLGGPPGSLGT